MDQYKEQALREYNDPATGAHPGGLNGRPYWNINASQFTFAPSFQFPFVPACNKYRFTATDCNGINHTFDADQPTASLAPIWGEIPTGFVTLKVESLGKTTGQVQFLIGARTFFKCAPFPGRDALPAAARSYRKAAELAFGYVFKEEMVQYWLEHGKPKPDYAHNVYPAKTISSIIHAMVNYGALVPEQKETALRLACRGADYLISISFPEGHPLEGLPPTYSFDGLVAEVVNEVAPAAKNCVGTTMMLYPVSAGRAYLALAKATGEKKYVDAALTIGEFYKKNRTPAGSWYLLYDCETGKPLKDNLCVDFNFVYYFHELYEVTGDEIWQELELENYKFITETCLSSYNWEGQFEDIPVEGNYRNLTHFTADRLIGYIAQNHKDNEAMVEVAKDLMRFVEDQFVVWGEFAYWSDGETNVRHTPAGLEQYLCYVPIDSSTATIVQAFADMYRITGDRLYLEKAMALANIITVRQRSDTGMIPTFFIGEDCAYGHFNFWINCHSHTASVLQNLAELTEAEGIE